MKPRSSVRTTARGAARRRSPELHTGVADAPQLTSPARPNRLSIELRISLPRNALCALSQRCAKTKTVGAKLALTSRRRSLAKDLPIY